MLIEKPRNRLPQRKKLRLITADHIIIQTQLTRLLFRVGQAVNQANLHLFRIRDHCEQCIGPNNNVRVALECFENGFPVPDVCLVVWQKWGKTLLYAIEEQFC